MSNEEYDDQEKGAIGRIIKVIIFVMVGIILVTSIAVPVLTTVGDRETTLTNTGVPFSNITEKYTEKLHGYDSGTIEITWGDTGVFISGKQSGVTHSEKILDKKDYKTGFPLIMIHPTSGYTNIIVEYIKPTFTKYESGGERVIQSAGSQSISANDSIYVQDPDGTLVLSKEGVYCSDPSQVIGFGYDYNPVTGASRFIWSDGSTATTVIKE